ncbi:MAG: hypothetical protein NTZ16_08085 [Verrucomicrobia bacterium]|nr:hypothetical protein [Verrucomicrobiota bacterium]
MTKPAESKLTPLAAARARRVAHLAETERRRILHWDILGQREVHLYPLAEIAASEELSRFAAEIWNEPKMHGYFDRQHLVNLRNFVGEARHGFATLASGGILEILVIPTMPDEVMGFHIFTVFDPLDDADKGRCIGYTIWSLEKGDVGFGRAEAVRMAFDIFPPFREGRYRKVPFTNHEVYNISRRLLYRFRPRQFLVDAKTQISQTRTGDRLHRMIYYLKRGYYPPDRKALADACLLRLAREQHIGERSVERLLRQTHAVFWIYPVEKYVQRALTELTTGGHVKPDFAAK